jgi:two-component system, cell cycle response regulator DivK
MTEPALVLIVEDNPRNLKLARDLLDYAGYRTLTATTAEDGIELARSQRPHLVLMDVQLPGMDGVSALALLREETAFAAVPVVALTAFAMKDDAARFLAAGFDAYIEKPLDVRAFPAQIAAILAPKHGARA